MSIWKAMELLKSVFSPEGTLKKRKDHRKKVLYKSGRKSPSETSPWGHIVPGLLISKHKNMLLKPFILLCILEWQAEQINTPEVSSADDATAVK